MPYPWRSVLLFLVLSGEHLAHIHALSLGYSDILLFSGFALDTQKGMLLTMVGANRKEKTSEAAALFVENITGPVLIE